MKHGLQIIMRPGRIHKDEYLSLSVEVQLVSTVIFRVGFRGQDSCRLEGELKSSPSSGSKAVNILPQP